MYINNPSSAVKSAAASKYAKAINTEGYANSRVAHVFAGFASFASNSSSMVTPPLFETLDEKIY